MPKLISINNSPEDSSITFNDLEKIILRYKADRIQKLPKELNKDSRAVWISKDKILEFFQKNSTANGVRFYFGVVDDATLKNGVHNLVLIPTAEDLQDQVSDHDSVLITQNSIPKPLATQMAVASTANTSIASNSLICPPPIDRCKGSSFLNPQAAN